MNQNLVYINGVVNSMKKTALYPWHAEHNAKIIDFAGWQMPLHYGDGAISEHKLVRESAGLFDVSHMGQIMVLGDGSQQYLEALISSSIADVGENASTYGLICREDGGVLDDLFVYRLKDRWLIVVNAANREKDLAWFQQHAEGYEVSVRDRSDEMSMIALQGPRAMELLNASIKGNAKNIERFHCSWLELFGVSALVGRTGYTGEDGVEIFASWEEIVPVWENVMKLGNELGIEIGAVGLAARDSLRFEAGFALYGHELDEETLPPEALLKWACDFDKDFIGKEAIQDKMKEGLKKKLATVSMIDRGVPREGYPVYSLEGEKIGMVVSGMYAPTLDAYCANVFLASEFAKRNTEIEVDIRGRRKKAQVVKRPLYKPVYR
jgi:glycine cleavage system T protein